MIESSSAAESQRAEQGGTRSPYRWQAGPFKEFCMKTRGFIHTNSRNPRTEGTGQT